MATAAKKKPAVAEGRQPRQQGLSDTQRWSYGFALLAVALFILVSVVSYFIYWSKDQAVARFGQVFDATQDPVSNWGGKLGAVTANYIVGEWFGLFGICIPIVLIVLSLRIMRYRPMLLHKSVRLMLVLMILGSLALGYIFGDAWGVFGTGLGGAHGIYVARWLNSLIGVLGTGLLLALAFVIYAVYINRNTIGVINRLGKGMVDNSKKLGEVITSTAADLLPHDSRKEGDESFDNVVGADVSAGQNGTKQTGEGESAGASASCLGSPLAPSGGQPGVITDEEGFSVIIPGASVPNTVGEDFYDQVPRVAEQTDEDGFVIIKPVEEPDSNVQPLQPVTRVDENGFEITGLPVENSDASAAGLTGILGTGSDAQISGSGMSVTAADGAPEHSKKWMKTVSPSNTLPETESRNSRQVCLQEAGWMPRRRVRCPAIIPSGEMTEPIIRSRPILFLRLRKRRTVRPEWRPEMCRLRAEPTLSRRCRRIPRSRVRPI